MKSCKLSFRLVLYRNLIMITYSNSMDEKNQRGYLPFYSVLVPFKITDKKCTFVGK